MEPKKKRGRPKKTKKLDEEKKADIEETIIEKTLTEPITDIIKNTVTVSKKKDNTMKKIGTKREVFYDQAIQTSGGLTKKDLMEKKDKQGKTVRIVSIKKHKQGIKNLNDKLEKMFIGTAKKLNYKIEKII